jgi:hypothetical protein
MRGEFPPAKMLVSVECPRCEYVVVFQCFEPDYSVGEKSYTYEMNSEFTTCHCEHSKSELQDLFWDADEKIDEGLYWFW